VAVSNESAGGEQRRRFASSPGKRLQRPLTEDEWKLARIQFETGERDISHDRIAEIFKTSVSSVHKRAAAEKWSKTSNLVVQTRNQLKAATERHISAAADRAGKQVAKSLMDDLAPLLEREKRAQIKRALKRSKRGQRRLDKIASGYQVVEPKTGAVVTLELGPKDEMYLASAEDKYDNILRRNLGMNDNQLPGGAFNVSILTNHAAVQVNAPNDLPNESQ
jgi:hypothetical protein